MNHAAKLDHLGIAIAINFQILFQSKNSMHAPTSFQKVIVENKLARDAYTQELIQQCTEQKIHECSNRLAKKAWDREFEEPDTHLFCIRQANDGNNARSREMVLIKKLMVSLTNMGGGTNSNVSEMPLDDEWHFGPNHMMARGKGTNQPGDPRSPIQ